MPLAVRLGSPRPSTRRLRQLYTRGARWGSAGDIQSYPGPHRLRQPEGRRPSSRSHRRLDP
eukprot:10328423-Alexandrium_andersonii.AAC.1